MKSIESKKDVLMGVLLTIPLYAVIHIIACILQINHGNYYMLMAFCRIIPIIIGVLSSFSMYKDKANLTFGIIITLLSSLYIILFHDFYFVAHPGWTGFNSFFNYMGVALLTRILSYIYYGKLAGSKKGWSYFGISIGVTILLILIIVAVNAGV